MFDEASSYRFAEFYRHGVANQATDNLFIDGLAGFDKFIAFWKTLEN